MKKVLFNESLKKEGFSMNKELLEKIRHEFSFLHGLYASDLEDFTESFQLNYTNLIKEIDEELDSL